MLVKQKTRSHIAQAALIVTFLISLISVSFAEESSVSEELEIPLFILDAASEHGQTFASNTPVGRAARFVGEAQTIVGTSARIKDGIPVLETVVDASSSTLLGTVGYRVCGLAAATALCVPANGATPLGYAACVGAVSTACLYGGQELGSDFADQVSPKIRSAYEGAVELIEAIHETARAQAHTAWVNREIEAVKQHAIASLAGSGVSEDELEIFPINLSPQDNLHNEYMVFTDSALFCGSAGCPINLYQLGHRAFEPKLILATGGFTVSIANEIVGGQTLVPIIIHGRLGRTTYYYNGSEYEMGQTEEWSQGQWGDWLFNVAGFPFASANYADEWIHISFSLYCRDDGLIRLSTASFAGGAYTGDRVFLAFPENEISWRADLEPPVAAPDELDGRMLNSVTTVPTAFLEALEAERSVLIHSALYRGSILLNGSADAIGRLRGVCNDLKNRNEPTADREIIAEAQNLQGIEAVVGEWIAERPNTTMDTFGTPSRQILFTRDGRFGLVVRSTGVIGRHLTANNPIVWGTYEVSGNTLIMTTPGSGAFSPPEVRRGRFQREGTDLVLDGMRFRPL